MFPDPLATGHSWQLGNLPWCLPTYINTVWTTPCNSRQKPSLNNPITTFFSSHSRSHFSAGRLLLKKELIVSFQSTAQLCSSQFWLKWYTTHILAMQMWILLTWSQPCNQYLAPFKDCTALIQISFAPFHSKPLSCLLQQFSLSPIPVTFVALWHIINATQGNSRNKETHMRSTQLMIIFRAHTHILRRPIKLCEYTSSNIHKWIKICSS